MSWRSREKRTTGRVNTLSIFRIHMVFSDYDVGGNKMVKLIKEP